LDRLVLFITVVMLLIIDKHFRMVV